MQKQVRAHRRVTSLLLIFATLFVSIAVFVPTSVLSAGNGKPTNLLTPYTTADSINDDSTTLNFLFLIDASFSGSAGIVYSTTNQNPKVGGSGCTNKIAYRVYGSLINGKKWMASETNTIRKSHYSDPLYVRAYVSDSSGIKYSALMITSVEAAFLKDWIGDEERFDFSDFGGSSITKNLEGTACVNYDDTPVTPTVGQHPRVLFTESDLPGIRTALDNAPDSPWPSKGDGAAQRYEAVMADPPTGILSSGKYNAKTLNDIQLVALAYQMTGNQTFGYRAIYAIKNVLKTMSKNWTMSDKYRNYGHVMYVAACVYDWCYDLLTENDRRQIVAGVQHKCCEGDRMEIGFPPKKQGAITGHGSEYQLLRDYLAFAIAIYDEYPGWWNFIAGRFYEEYVPVRNEFYKAGMVPQGTSLYVRIRFTSDLYSALLIKAATGTFPYASESKMKQVMRTVYSYELPKLGGSNYHAFESGDNHTDDRDFQDYGRCALFASYLFNDQTMRAQLENGKWSCSVFDDSLTMRASVAEYLICSSSGVKKASSRHQDMPLILYNGGWLGQIIARDAWDSTQAAVLMKIGRRTAGNHDHADAGQFQIWYKGMLAGDTGSYDSYNDNHFKNYHQATVAHNCILIDNEGQKQPGETGNFNNGGSSAWLTGDTYQTGSVMGKRYDYSDSKETTPAYAYIAGDLTPAYSNTGKVSSYNRRMLTVFDTADEDEELYFFVYDSITTTSASCQKKFLLHVPTNPTIKGNKVTVVNEQGAKLVLQSVFGGDTITKVGGVVYSGGNYDPMASSNYKLHGTQIANENTSDDGFWGRVEIKPATGSKKSELLNVIYVCDENDEINLTAQAISSSKVKGAVLGNTAAVFVSSSTPLSSSHSFSVPGSGTKKYYISGVANGSWTVKRNGTTVGTYQAEGGLLVFTAQTGTIELVK
ncbi:MAG: heparinase II/III family protein [Clostridia bacterium]|nr:heparinase II/III family protein [Clostridia bacterium]